MSVKSGAFVSSEYRNRAHAFRNDSCMRACVLLRCISNPDSSVPLMSHRRRVPMDTVESKPPPRM